MAGHSKWANIKHRKERQDKKKGKMWSKCSRAIIAAARAGGPDPETNLTLRYAIDEAKYANMPKDTIQRAVDKGAGAAGGEDFQQIAYERYGPAGVAVLVDALTDNNTRTVSEVRNIFNKGGGNMGNAGSVAATLLEGPTELRHRLPHAGAAEREKAHGGRNSDIDAHNARQHPIFKFTGHCTAVGIKTGGIAETTGVDQIDDFIQVFCTDSGISEHRHDMRLNFQDTARYEEGLFVISGLQAYFTRLQARNHLRVTGCYTNLTHLGRGKNHLSCT